GAITPTTGTSSDDWRAGSAAEVAALHATTISFTPWRSRYPPISCAKRAISPSGRGPYGRRAWSPRETESSWGIVTRHACRTVRPPTPESKTPMGRVSTAASLTTGADFSLSRVNNEAGDTCSHRHVLLGRRRPRQALVPEGRDREGAPGVVRGALLDRRG